MGFLKNILFVPVVMACATIGTIGMIFGVGKFLCDSEGKGINNTKQNQS